MTIGSILLGIALLVLVGLFVTRPLIMPDPYRRRRMTERQKLVAQKEAILTLIRNLDFDYDTGKIPELNYKQQREGLVDQAAEILQQMDELDQTPDTWADVVEMESEKPRTGQLSDIEMDIEAAIEGRRSSALEVTGQLAEQPEKANGNYRFCPECGLPVSPEDKFCASCGHKLLLPQGV